jgi:phosphate transport system permease protein
MVSIFDTASLPPVDDEDQDQPRQVRTSHSRGDTVFRALVRSCGALALVITGAIGVFLGYQLIPTLQRYGSGFFTDTLFYPNLNRVGILSALVGTVLIAVIALLIAFPIALLTALYISEYAPARLKAFCTSVIDLMAAVPSIVYGAWGLAFLQPQIVWVARWLAQWLGWIPIFEVPSADPSSAVLAQSRFQQGPFAAGVVVALMVIPLACAVMRNVFGQAPLGEREAAYALGATRWGMIRTVVLPYGLGGIIGGTMLGLGRALGETIAVLLIISPDFRLNWHILSNGTITISALIANDFGDTSAAQLSALLAAGFVLFLMTLVVNTAAAIIVSRGRSGTGVEL